MKIFAAEVICWRCKKPLKKNGRPLKMAIYDKNFTKVPIKDGVQQALCFDCHERLLEASMKRDTFVASEKETARVFSGKRQPASGSMPSKFLKGDVKSSKFVVEVKTTSKKSYSLNIAAWNKIREIANVNARIPVMRITLADGSDRPRTIYVISDELMEDFVREYQRSDSQH